MQYLDIRLALKVSGLVVALLSSCAATAVDVLTQHYDKARTGANLQEPTLTTANVGPATFGKLWTLYADGQIVAQPLYVSALNVDTTANANTPLVRGVFNAVIVATMHNTVYVYDADRENLGADGRTVPLWATWLGQPRPGGKDIDMWSTNDPEWGILGTPVVSDDKQTLYVVAWHDQGQGQAQYRLHALRLRDGTESMPATVIGAAVRQKQRTALLLDNGVIYVAFGGDGNRGSLFAFDAGNLRQIAMWNSTPTGEDGGIWQSGQGPSADAQGNVYLMIGNGTFDADRGGKNYGDSFVKLRLEGQSISVKDYFAPCNQQFLDDKDLDLGSSGPVLIPDTGLLMGGGKEGVLYLISSTSLGKYVPSPTAPDCSDPNAIQEFQATTVLVDGGTIDYGNIHGSPVFWKGPDTGRAYVWGENNPLKAFVFEQGRFQHVDAPRESAFRPPNGMPGGMLAVSANGSKAGSGIVWAVVPLDGDANNQRGVSGIVLALDAQDVSRTLWTSEQTGPRDRLGLFAKFNTPVVADGKLFVATYGDSEPLGLRKYAGASRPTQFPARYYVAVYGLLQAPPPPPRPIVNQGRDDVTIVRASTRTLVLDTSRCKPGDPGTIDCTDALALASAAPSLHKVIFASGQNVSSCALLDVTAAAKDTGLDNATGIGFWSEDAAAGNLAADSGRFIAKNQLKSVGTATLLNGAPATLYEFVGVVNCALAGSDSLARLFKPYMQFEGAPDGKIYRNWDLASNYRISKDVARFDRSADVLRQ